MTATNENVVGFHQAFLAKFYPGAHTKFGPNVDNINRALMDDPGADGKRGLHGATFYFGSPEMASFTREYFGYGPKPSVPADTAAPAADSRPTEAGGTASSVLPFLVLAAVGAYLVLR